MSSKMVKKTPKKTKIAVSHVVIRVYARPNNTHITVTNAAGDTLTWGTAGANFKGSRKRTPHAAETAAHGLIDKLKSYGVQTADGVVKGIGPGREAAFKPFEAAGIKIKMINDKTAVAHNGCRPSKKRRT